MSVHVCALDHTVSIYYKRLNQCEIGVFWRCLCKLAYGGYDFRQDLILAIRFSASRILYQGDGDGFYSLPLQLGGGRFYSLYIARAT